MYLPPGRSTLSCRLRPSGVTQGWGTYSAASAKATTQAAAFEATGVSAGAESMDDDDEEELEEELDSEEALGDFGIGNRGFSLA